MKSKTYELEDPLAVQEYFHSRRWTDELPVVAPTPQSVQEMLDRANLDPEHLIGIEPVRNRRLLQKNWPSMRSWQDAFRIISLWCANPSQQC